MRKNTFQEHVPPHQVDCPVAFRRRSHQNKVEVAIYKKNENLRYFLSKNAKESFLCQIGIYLYERIPRGFGAHLSCLFNCGELEALFKCWLDQPSSADKADTRTVVNENPL